VGVVGVGVVGGLLMLMSGLVIQLEIGYAGLGWVGREIIEYCTVVQ